MNLRPEIPRTFLVGTDTAIGKTHVACQLIAMAQLHGRKLVPFKPAESFEPSDIADSQRLAEASGIPAQMLVAHRFEIPKAPGMADAARPFPLQAQNPAFSTLRQAADKMHELARLSPDGLIIEGAGGLCVPMPGGTWQLDWIRNLANQVVVVARAGLGTINHTLLTIAALRHADLEPVGIIFNAHRPIDPTFYRENIDVITAASKLPVLAAYNYERGTLIDNTAQLIEVLTANTRETR